MITANCCRKTIILQQHTAVCCQTYCQLLSQQSAVKADTQIVYCSFLTKYHSQKFQKKRDHYTSGVTRHLETGKGHHGGTRFWGAHNFGGGHTIWGARQQFTLCFFKTTISTWGGGHLTNMGGTCTPPPHMYATAIYKGRYVCFSIFVSFDQIFYFLGVSALPSLVKITFRGRQVKDRLIDGQCDRWTFYLLVSAKLISKFIIHPPFTSQLLSLPDWTLLQK